MVSNSWLKYEAEFEKIQEANTLLNSSDVTLFPDYNFLAYY